jgi:hypothetical protein
MEKFILKYDGGEIIITGCHDCNFCHYEERGTDYKPYCSIILVMPVEDRSTGEVKDFLPIACPLRNKINGKLLN